VDPFTYTVSPNLHRNTMSYKLSLPFHKWGRGGSKRWDKLLKVRAEIWIQDCLNPTPNPATQLLVPLTPAWRPKCGYYWNWGVTESRVVIDRWWWGGTVGGPCGWGFSSYAFIVTPSVGLNWYVVLRWVESAKCIQNWRSLAAQLSLFLTVLGICKYCTDISS